MDSKRKTGNTHIVITLYKTGTLVDHHLCRASVKVNYTCTDAS